MMCVCTKAPGSSGVGFKYCKHRVIDMRRCIKHCLSGSCGSLAARDSNVRKYVLVVYNTTNWAFPPWCKGIKFTEMKTALAAKDGGSDVELVAGTTDECKERMKKLYGVEWDKPPQLRGAPQNQD